MRVVPARRGGGRVTSVDASTNGGAAQVQAAGGRTIERAFPSSWPLLVVLALQAIIALTTLRNTVFQDEGLYLYAGQQILRHWMGGPALLESYVSYFSGYADFYPVIGGALDRIGGLELARGFSLVCMLGVTAVVYSCTRQLFQTAAAIFGSAVFASLGTVLFVGRLATFDSLCLLLIALATAVAYRVSAARRPWMAAAVGPLVVLSILTKYAGLLFVPCVLGLVVCGSVAFQGWRRFPSRFALAIGTLGVSLAVAYRLMDRAALGAIVGSTTNRIPMFHKPRVELLLHSLYMGGAVYVLAIVGLVLVFARCPRFRVMALILYGSSWLAPAYHIYKQEPISFDKHIAYSLFFAMPLAGYAVAWLAGGMQRAASEAWERAAPTARRDQPLRGDYGLAGLAVVLIVLTLGLQQSRTIYAGWADTSELSTVLHTQMRDGAGRYLSEDIEVARYEAKDITQPWQWNGPYYFHYVTASHQSLFGPPALSQAIKDQYFQLVELSLVHSPDAAYFIAGQMAMSRNYDLIAKIFYEGDLVSAGPLGNRYGRGFYYLWRSAPVAGHGTFTSLSQLGIGQW